METFLSDKLILTGDVLKILLLLSWLREVALAPILLLLLTLLTLS